MGDWESIIRPCGIIHAWTPESIGTDIQTSGGTTLYNTIAALNPTADLAYYIPFSLFTEILVTKLWSKNGGVAVAGNIDMRLYNIDGVAQTPSVQVAQAAVTFQEFDIADVLIAPGLFYIGIVLSDAAVALIVRGTMFANGAPAITGMQQQQLGVGAALPDVATFAPITGNFIPLCGLIVGPRTVI